MRKEKLVQFSCLTVALLCIEAGKGLYTYPSFNFKKKKGLMINKLEYGTQNKLIDIV